MKVVDEAIVETTIKEQLRVDDHILWHDHEMKIKEITGTEPKHWEIIAIYEQNKHLREKELPLIGGVHRIIRVLTYKNVCVNCRTVIKEGDYCEKCIIGRR